MKRAIAVIIVAGATALGLADVAFAQFPSDTTPEVSARPNPRPGRARTRITVTPRARITVNPAYPYRTYSTTFPVPYTYEYPGPGHVRQCSSWLAAENRPSGAVIVPRLRCWRQPGRDPGPHRALAATPARRRNARRSQPRPPSRATPDGCGPCSPDGPRNCGSRSRHSARQERVCRDSSRGTWSSRARAIRTLL